MVENESCGGDGEVGSVTPDSAAGGRDTETELVLGSLVSGPAGCVGGEVGNHSPLAVGSGTDEMEAVELVDGVGDDCPERFRKGDMGWIEGHARTRP